MAALAENCAKCLLRYVAFATVAVGHGVSLYNVVSKVHCPWRIVQFAELLKPRASRCYAYEDCAREWLMVVMARASATFYRELGGEVVETCRPVLIVWLRRARGV